MHADGEDELVRHVSSEALKLSLNSLGTFQFLAFTESYSDLVSNAHSLLSLIEADVHCLLRLLLSVLRAVPPR